MGQAKRRGTFEQRLEQALARRKLDPSQTNPQDFNQIPQTATKSQIKEMLHRAIYNPNMVVMAANRCYKTEVMKESINENTINKA